MSPTIRIAPSAATKARNLLRTLQFNPKSCPCHSNPAEHHLHNNNNHHHNYASAISPISKASRRSYATPVSLPQSDYAFQMAASNIRFGPGCTQEVGMDFSNLHSKKVMIVTDSTVAQLPAMSQAVEGLESEGIKYEIYQKVKVEPKDTSIKAAIEFAKYHSPDAFLAIGGGSVIDTAKLMNLYTCNPEAEFLDFVNAPLGKGMPIRTALHPLIAIPTTAGTGSETTGTAIFDHTPTHSKTGIAHRNLKPTLGICDPLNTRTMPPAVHASSGLDVLCHALESYTAIPYHQRRPRPSNPINRPAYQGSNPISDVFALQALKSTIQYLPRAAKDPEDAEAQSEMLLAATLAGVGFGNAGVHLCHGMSYPIASQNPGNYKHPGYISDDPIIPHGVSVAVTAPAVFAFTGASDPERHLTAARAFAVDTTNVKKENAGEVLAEALREFLVRLGDQPRGLEEWGFKRKDVGMLVEGTLPQERVLMLAPNMDVREKEVEREQLTGLFEGAMSY